ncbi:hypothetical protein HOY80DRAFT_901664, partial [Tuber brumale]
PSLQVVLGKPFFFLFLFSCPPTLTARFAHQNFTSPSPTPSLLLKLQQLPSFLQHPPKILWTLSLTIATEHSDQHFY